MTSSNCLDILYGEGAHQKVLSARVLVVGAGGVGCELVKNLALTGFPSITLIDLDTIDVSNLNRQFLFRRKHVGKPKAIEAAAAIQSMVPNAKIEPIMANIKDSRFDLPFYKSYTLVCNALDNLEARRHVNRMCLAAQIPLVESGSTGYNGQCSVIGPGVECYDCTEKPPQKSYAVCTIRSTPDKPVHCVVWAKFLYELIFGPQDEANVLSDLDGNTYTNSQQITENGQNENNSSPKANSSDENHSTTNGNATSPTENTPKRKQNTKRVRFIPTDTPQSFATRVCERVFVDDIEEQRAMKELWTDRDPPLIFDINSVEQSSPVDLDTLDLFDQIPWTKEKSAIVFKKTLQEVVEKRPKEIGKLTFDKDDRHAHMFVTAAANLRAHAYGVPLQSPFAVKGIAGNIIHAIATTNAMVGGLSVLEALKIATSDGKIDKCLTTYVSRAPVGSRVRKILCPEKLQKPNKKCFVCSKGQLHLSIDTKTTTLRMLVTSILQKKMSILQPTVNVTTGDFHNTLYECGAGLEEDEIEEYEANLQKFVADMRVENGSQLIIEDFAQSVTCTLHVTHVKDLLMDKAVEERYILDGDVPSVKQVDGEEQEQTEDVDNDDIEEVEISNQSKVINKKRALESEVSNSLPTKLQGPEKKKARSEEV